MFYNLFGNFFLELFFIYINQENKERLEERAPERYQNLSKEEEKKQQYGHESYKNLSRDEKNKLVECRKKYYRMRKNPLL